MQASSSHDPPLMTSSSSSSPPVSSSAAAAAAAAPPTRPTLSIPSTDSHRGRPSSPSSIQATPVSVSGLHNLASLERAIEQNVRQSLTPNADASPSVLKRLRNQSPAGTTSPHTSNGAAAAVTNDPKQLSIPSRFGTRQPSAKDLIARFDQGISASNSPVSPAFRPSPRSVSANPRIGTPSWQTPANKSKSTLAPSSGPPSTATARIASAGAGASPLALRASPLPSAPASAVQTPQSGRKLLFGEFANGTPDSSTPNGRSASSRRGSQSSARSGTSAASDQLLSPTNGPHSLQDRWKSSPNLQSIPQDADADQTELRRVATNEAQLSATKAQRASRIPVSRRRSSMTEPQKPQSPDQPNAIRRPVTPPMLLSSRRYEPKQEGLGKQQTLQAIISAPAVKAFPSLRRTRPEESLSTASAADAKRASLEHPQDSQSSRSIINEPSLDSKPNSDVTTDTAQESVAMPLLQLTSAVYQRPPPRSQATIKPESPVEQSAEPAVDGDVFGSTSPLLNIPGTFLASPQSSNSSVSGFEFPETADSNDLATDATPRQPGAGKVSDRLSQTDFQRPIRFEELQRGRTELSHLDTHATNSLDSRDGETIQIMLGTTPDIVCGNVEWPPHPDNHLRPTENDTQHNWNVDVTPRAQNNNEEFFVRPPQASWESRLPRSSGYSIVNRVLEQYYEVGAVTPEMLHEFQQSVLERSPDLSQEDSLEIARTAVNDLIREKAGGRHSSIPLAGRQARFLEAQASSRDRSYSPGQDDWRSGRKHARNLSGNISDINLQSKYNPQGSRAASTEDPARRLDGDGDSRPTPPPKHYNYSPSRGLQPRTSSDSPHLGASPSRSRPANPPQLPDLISGAGLGLNIASDGRNDSAVILPLSAQHSYVQNASANSQDPAGKRTSPAPPDVQSMTSPPRPQSPPRRARSGSPLPARNDKLYNASSGVSSEQSLGASSSSAVGGATTPKPQSSPLLSAEDQRRLNKRKEIIKELVLTEYTYNHDMKVVEDIYKDTSNNILGDDDRRILFGNSKQIVQFSESFLDALKQAALSVYTLPKSGKWRLRKGSISTSNSGQTDQSSVVGSELSDEERDRKTFIGGAFNRNLARLEKVYGDYLKNQDNANIRLQKLQSQPKVALWLKECQTYATDITSAWDLDSLIVKPVQRMLKYPLLLTAILETTPKDHPDHDALEMAAKEMTAVSRRINESKKRADLVDQVVNRKRKDSESRLGLPKAFTRRTEKLRQQVGLSDAVEDPEYKAISEKFGGHFFQLQVVMRDVQYYLDHVQKFVDSFNQYTLSLEGIIDTAPSCAPEMESKWRKFASIVRELTTIALIDHKNAIKKCCIDPMITLLSLHDKPQTLMAKRKKRIVDYARFKSIKDRGSKPDKKTQEQADEYQVLNDTLKDELPKLFSLTAKLVEACLKNFVDIQAHWSSTWQNKIKAVLEEQQIPKDASDIIEAFLTDFQYPEAQVKSMPILNGTFLAESASLLSSSGGARTPHGSRLANDSPSIASNEFASSGHGYQGPSDPRESAESVNRLATNISTSSIVTNTHRAPAQNTSSSSYFVPRPSGNTQRYTDPNPPAPLSRLSSDSSIAGQRPTSTSTYYTSVTGLPGVQLSRRLSGVFSTDYPLIGSPYDDDGPLTPIERLQQPYLHNAFAELSSSTRNSQVSQSSGPNQSAYPLLTPPYQPAPQTTSGSQSYSHSHSHSNSHSQSYFPDVPSTTPMSTSTTDTSNSAPSSNQERVLFLAASLFEFNIDRARREAGWPYLTYQPGEVFDVIHERGELWLARNQDDPSRTVGWIWEKHFAKLVGEEGAWTDSVT